MKNRRLLGRRVRQRIELRAVMASPWDSVQVVR